jgi:hypothetical protein
MKIHMSVVTMAGLDTIGYSLIFVINPDKEN